MPDPQDVELIAREGYLEARYLGAYSFERYVRQMDVSVAACGERGHTLLLVDITNLEGYAPTLVERYRIGEHGASISGKLSRVAAFGTPVQIPESFASLVASNRGLMIRAFTDRAAAVAFLMEAIRRA